MREWVDVSVCERGWKEGDTEREMKAEENSNKKNTEEGFEMCDEMRKRTPGATTK